MSYELPEFPPSDWAVLPEAWYDDDYDDEEGMRVSAMAVIALLCGALGLVLGWLIWG